MSYEVLIGQDEWIEPNRPLPEVVVPRRPWRVRLLLGRQYKVECRIQPRRGTLESFGRMVSESVGTTWPGVPREGDRAVWLVGFAYGWTKRIAAQSWIDGLLARLPENTFVVSFAMRLTRV